MKKKKKKKPKGIKRIQMKGTKNHVLLLTGRTEHAQVPVFVSIWLISSLRFVCFAFPMP